MAQMIPRNYDPRTTTYSEQQVFNALTQLPGSYVVLHSLHLPRHIKQAQGEIDFAVIGPRGVLCLEVKGGAVAQRDGRWYMDVDPRPRTSPFTQAMDNMHSLRDVLDRRAKSQPEQGLPRPLVGCGVILPHVELDPTAAASDASINPEVLLDRRDGLGDIEGFVNRCYDYWQRTAADTRRAWFQATLTKADVHALKQTLRGDFDCAVPMDSWLDQAERLLETEECDERLRFFDVADEELRIALCGVAGSGKTALSLEYARRRALAGDEVLFLCFNKNLRRYLEASLDPRVTAWTFHDYLEVELPADRLPPIPAPGQSLNSYYQEQLPQAYIDFANETGRQSRFDCLVVDEGQDLLRAAYVRCLDLLLSGGLRGGRWQIAYDANQDIYNRDSKGAFNELVCATGAHRYPLRLNHRNAASIAIFNKAFTGLDCGRPRIPVFRPPVTVAPYDDRFHQLELAGGFVRQAISEGVARSRIVLLGRRTLANSCLAGDPAALGPDLPVLDLGSELTAAHLSADTLKYCTIWSYKGIDAPVVVLLDVDRDTYQDKHLCHTGISRARGALALFYDQSLHPQVDQVTSSYAAELALAQGRYTQSGGRL